jgi:uncharacterized protein (UPF0371 family)
MSISSVKIGFDTDKYIKYQSRVIEKVLKKSHDKLYIEFGGKLIQDKHSARVLPGYREDTKFELIKKLCRHGEPIFVVSSKDIIKGRIRGDFGTTYDNETIRTLRELEKRGLVVKHTALTMLDPNKPIPQKIKKMEKVLKIMGITTHHFFSINCYKPEHELLVELERNPFILTKKKLVLIISPDGGSGKFGICLNQLYHEMKQGKSPRYHKFETFPVHDLPIKHPINLAYMSASADFYDIVMKDKRHGKASSYNRDLDNYELLHFIARQFNSEGKHLRSLSSATNMGMNMLSQGIIDDELVQKEAAAEIARRLMRYKFEAERGDEDLKVVDRVRNILAML